MAAASKYQASSALMAGISENNHQKIAKNMANNGGIKIMEMKKKSGKYWKREEERRENEKKEEESEENIND